MPTQIVFCKQLQRLPKTGALYGFYAPNASDAAGDVLVSLQRLLDSHLLGRRDGSPPRSGAVLEALATLADGRTVALAPGDEWAGAGRIQREPLPLSKIFVRCSLAPSPTQEKGASSRD